MPTPLPFSVIRDVLAKLTESNLVLINVPFLKLPKRLSSRAPVEITDTFSWLRSPSALAHVKFLSEFEGC